MNADGSAATPQPQDQLSVEFRILDLFKTGNVLAIGPTDVQDALGISKGSASVKLRLLAQAGYLEELPGKEGKGKYAPGFSMWAISAVFYRTMAQHNLQLNDLLNQHLAVIRRMMEMMASNSPALAVQP